MIPDESLTTPDAADPERPARARPERTPPRRPAQVFDTPESAAAKLGLDVNALRARCRRAARRVGDDVIAYLGGGITAFKFGKSWRIRFPPE